MRRLGAADGVLRWHFVKADRIAQNELLSPRFQWMAAKETDEFNTRPTTFIEAEGTSLKAALDVARKFGTVRDSVLPFATGSALPGQREDLLRDRGAAEDQHVLQPRPRAGELAPLAGDQGADPHAARRRLAPGTRRRRPRASSTPTSRRPSAAATPSRSSATRRTASSSATAGAPAGATRASATRRSPTRRTRSPRRTESSSSAHHQGRKHETNDWPTRGGTHRRARRRPDCDGGRRPSRFEEEARRARDQRRLQPGEVRLRR